MLQEIAPLTFLTSQDFLVRTLKKAPGKPLSAFGDIEEMSSWQDKMPRHIV